MQLPDSFLADLPPGASLTPATVREACLTLKRNRARSLATCSSSSVIDCLSELGEAWRDESYPFRQLALERGPEAAGFPTATLARGLDSFFGQLTPENIEELLAEELGDGRRLDEMVELGSGRGRGRGPAAMACGPELLAHITAGTVPSATLMSVVLGLLVRSAQFVKCARGSSWLLRLFAHSIREAAPQLGGCLEIAEWPGGDRALEEALFEQASCVTATGSDETVTDIRRRLPGPVRFLGYGHRVSFGYVAPEKLSRAAMARWVNRAVDDVAAWNQRGCLSPHAFYVQWGGHMTPEQFAESLAAQLEAREQTEPRGPLPVADAAAIASRRDLYELRAAVSGETRLWRSAGSTAWTVVYELDPSFQLSCLNRFVYVKAVSSLAEALQRAEIFRGRVSTVGLAAPESTARRLATELAQWGVPRVCPLGQMQNPPLTWRHDGRPALADLITWTGWERHYAD